MNRKYVGRKILAAAWLLGLLEMTVFVWKCENSRSSIRTFSHRFWNQFLALCSLLTASLNHTPRAGERSENTNVYSRQRGIGISLLSVPKLPLFTFFFLLYIIVKRKCWENNLIFYLVFEVISTRFFVFSSLLPSAVFRMCCADGFVKRKSYNYRTSSSVRDISKYNSITLIWVAKANLSIDFCLDTGHGWMRMGRPKKQSSFVFYHRKK